MNDEHKQEIGIPKEHELILKDSTWKQKHGQDTDTYWYNEIDKNGEIINKYIVFDSTSMYLGCSLCRAISVNQNTFYD